MTRRPYAIAAVALAAAAIAGCGGGGKTSYGGSGPSGKSGATAATGPVSVKRISIGSVLADSSGRTLYVFAKDTKNHSNCSGACAQNWPPAQSAPSPKAGSGVTPSKLTAIKRSDGGRQLAYVGQPLYRFSGDTASGD